jgi:hypothetical protein
MLEMILKLAGSIAGFAVQPFISGRPKAEFAIKKLGVNPYSYIRVKNPGPGTVLIKEVRVEPPIYVVAKNDSAEAIAGAVYDDVAASALLGPDEECHLPIIDRRNQLEKDAPQTVRFTIYWCKASSTRLWRPPVWIMTSTQHIKQMGDAATPWRGVP